MRHLRFRHGCLLLWTAPGWAVAQPEPVPVSTRFFEVDYQINPASHPLYAVTLWCTVDQGRTWKECAQDADRRSPLTVETPGEGLIGLYLIAMNETGPSSVPPTAATAPHLEVLSDLTPPVVQLHSVRPVRQEDRPALQIRWTAVDAHFGPRPVVIEFRQPPQTPWKPIQPEALANSGQCDWVVPTDMEGAWTIRVSAVDRVGHRTESEEITIEIPRPPVPEAPVRTVRDSAPAVPGGRRSFVTPPALDDTAIPGSPRARQRAAQLIEEAVALREQGDHRESASRLRFAVRLDPQNPEAFAEMGDTLYRLGDSDRALEAYELALSKSPTMRGALRGSARVHAQRKEYGRAVERLRTILRHNPNDSEVWLNLGDVAVYQGDETLARECYLRAGQINPEAKAIVQEAQRRLTLMSEASRRPSGGNP